MASADSGRPHLDGDPLLEQVFAAIQLPDCVHQERHADQLQHEHRDEHDAVLRELDQVLSEHAQAHRHARVEHGTEHHRNSALDSALHGLNGIAPTLQRAESLESERERFDAFPADGPAEPKLGSRRPDVGEARPRRTATMDSWASAAESRAGGFSLRDSSQLDLHHPHVAYRGLDEEEQEQEEQEWARPKAPAHATAAPEARLSAQLLQDIRSFGRAHDAPAEQLNSVQSAVPANGNGAERFGKDRSATYDSVYSADNIYEQVHYGNNNNNYSNPKKDYRVEHLPQQPDQQHQPRTALPKRSSLRTVQVREQRRALEECAERECGPVPPPPASEAVQHRRRAPPPLLDRPPSPGPFLAYQLRNAEPLGRQGALTFFQPYFQLRSHARFPEIRVGGPAADPADEAEEKTLLLLGASGAGKTLFIYSLLNFLYDCPRESNFRLALELPGAFEQLADRVVSYSFANTLFPFRLTVLDTPGLERVGTPRLLAAWIKHRLDRDGSLRLDALVPVLSAQGAPPSAELRRHLHQVQFLLGDDLRANVLPVFTHCAGGRAPPAALKALQTLRLPFARTFPLDSLGFLPQDGSVSGLQHSLLHKNAVVTLEAFMQALDTDTVPLLLAKTVRRR